MFSLGHFIWLGIFAAIIIAALILLKKCKIYMLKEGIK